MAKLTDKQRKKIIAEYVEGGTSQRKLAEKYHVSPYLIRSILNGDMNLAQKISHKKEENTASVLAFMDSKKNDVCGLIDKLLAAMGDEDKLAAATISLLPLWVSSLTNIQLTRRLSRLARRRPTSSRRFTLPERRLT